MFIYDLMKGGDNIGRLFIMEFAYNENSTFDEGMGCLKRIRISKCVKCKKNLNYLSPDLKFILSAEKYIVTAKEFI